MCLYYLNKGVISFAALHNVLYGFVSSFKVFSSPSHSKKSSRRPGFSSKALRVRLQSSLYGNSLPRHRMLSDIHSQDLIRWADTADSFFGLFSLSFPFSIKSLIVLDHERFAREILPRWFKHQNFASFVRQLNMYGFHKILHLQQGVLRSDTGETEYWNFAHENFRRDQPDLLCLIHRKKGNLQQQPGAGAILAPEEGILDVCDLNTPTPQSATAPIAPHGITLPASASGQVLDINSIFQGITTIKKHQTTISEELQQLKQSNQLLWQESIAARERLQKNEDTVQRIVKFLAGIFGNRRAEGAHPEHTHAGHNEGERRAEGRNERAVVPAQRRSDGSSSGNANARGRKPRLMIEGAKDSMGKGMGNVGIVEVDEDNGDDVVEIIVGDDGDDGDMNLNTGSSYNNNYGEYSISIVLVFVCVRHLAFSGPLFTLSLILEYCAVRLIDDLFNSCRDTLFGPITLTFNHSIRCYGSDDYRSATKSEYHR